MAENNLRFLTDLAVILCQVGQKPETDKNLNPAPQSRSRNGRRYLFNASTNCGTTWNRSPTIP
jgi:hypothetical protein